MTTAQMIAYAVELIEMIENGGGRVVNLPHAGIYIRKDNEGEFTIGLISEPGER